MAQQPINDRAKAAAGLTTTNVIAVALAVGWMVVISLFFWILPPRSAQGEGFDSLRFVLMLMAVFLPAAVIWAVVAIVGSARTILDELFRLQGELDRIRQAYLAQQAMHQPAGEPAADAGQEAILASARATQIAGQTAGSRFASRREVSRLIVPRAAPQMPSDQSALALDPAPEDTQPPLERPDLIRALNFPNDEHDTDGFAALRRALRDRNARKLVQASQDVLTLLSQDGVYMDDLRPDPVGSDVWRRFAKGERGRAMDQLGAVRDPGSLALAAGRMREDTIFRDVVHHFLRRFDQTLVTFEEHATDTDLLALAETRTARAFMLLGRATGTFD